METYGFKLTEEKELAEVGGTARVWIHSGCGARLLSVVNNDENKCFGVSFYTPPTDSTGVAHILEHSVLNGSREYPVREPFAELLKGSLQTFLNAFTFPDKTCYPAASANLQDFYNLIAVYMDAVFHPLLTKDTFAQEGWHIEADTADGPWSYKGVVYNEMKGVYSSPDSILAEKSQQSLFPDNLYSLDSGGFPRDIPNLTYEAFIDFHRRYYAPGNAFFFFWGDDPEAERLRIVGEACAGAAPVSDPPEVNLQKPFAKPRYLDLPYAAAEGDARALFALNWLLPERAEMVEAMKLEMLEHILDGLPGSPLRRALTDSGLGEDVIGRGLETDLRQMYYSIGLKGIARADAEKGETLIMETLSKLAKDGVDPDAVAAAVNTVEFAYRENNAGRFPRGLCAMILSLSSWLYGGDPLAPLAWEKPLAEIKASLAKGEKIFEAAIEKYFLNNPTRGRVTLYPDEKLGAVVSGEERNRLDSAQAEASLQQRQEYAAKTAKLKEAQLKPDSPEALATIPTLKVSDLPRENKLVPCEIEYLPQACLTHLLPTSGVAYVDILLPLNRLPLRLVPYVPLFARSLTDWGTAKEDFARLGTRIAGKLGGLNCFPYLGSKLKTREPFAYLKLAAKSVYGHLPDMFAIFAEILLEPQKDQKIILRRLKQMALEDKARLEHGLQAAGHLTVASRVRAHFTGEGALSENMSGLNQLLFLRGLLDDLAQSPDKILADFETLREAVIGSEDAIVNLTAEKAGLEKARAESASLLKKLPPKRTDALGEIQPPAKPLADLPGAEAILTQGQVNYVAKGANLYDLGFEYTGAANVVNRWLKMGKLWEEVRVAGGAYGVFCSLDRVSGSFVCASYRDPNVDRTLSVYDGLGPFLEGFSPARSQVDQAIIGAVGDLDAYLLPDAKGAASLQRWLIGLTPEIRQKTREETLAASAADFGKFGAALAAFAESGVICVCGGEKTRDAASEHGWATRELL